MWRNHILSTSYLSAADFAPLRGHSVTVNWSHSRNTKGTSVVSVPRREGMATDCESRQQQPADVTMETAISSRLRHTTNAGRSPVRELSTGVRSAVRNRVSERCVNSVPSAVALRKCELRTSQLSTCEWRQSVPSRVTASPPASPKDMLASVFERMKRTARAKKFERITERFATQFLRKEEPLTGLLQ
jgi:hypothetical protein